MPIARGTLRRRGTLRIPGDVAYRVRIGHPWIFRDALGGRPMREQPGDVVEVVDPTGAFVAKGLYDPEAAIAVRVVTRDVNELVDAALVHRRIATAQALRAGLPELAGLDALRVLTGESEGLPGVTVERFADYLVVHVFTGALVPLLEALYDALEAAYHPRGIYEQRRFRSLGGEAPRGPAELRRGAAAPPEVEVREGAVRFGVDVTAPLSTGLFPDLREGRRAIERRSAGRRVLNLFSYTGAIALYAVRGGAKQVVNVDLAAKAHARARRNFSLNDMNPEAAEYIAEDALKTLGDLHARPRRFDLIVLDPPSFGQSKAGVFSTLKDYGTLVGEALKVLDPGGLLVAVANTAKMSVEEHDKAIAEGASRVGADLRIIERCGLPPDYPVAPGFPEGNYLKCAIAVRA